MKIQKKKQTLELLLDNCTKYAALIICVFIFYSLSIHGTENFRAIDEHGHWIDFYPQQQFNEVGDSSCSENECPGLKDRIKKQQEKVIVLAKEAQELLEPALKFEKEHKKLKAMEKNYKKARGMLFRGLVSACVNVAMM